MDEAVYDIVAAEIWRDGPEAMEALRIAGPLVKSEIDWLHSLVRMRIRKMRRNLLVAERKAQQSEEEFKAFKQYLEERIRFADATLVHLEEMSRACSSHAQ